MTRIVAILSAIVFVAIGGYLYLGGPALETVNPLVGAANAQQAEDIDTSSIVEMVEGSEDAPVTIIEYASFTCPHCASFHEGTYQQIKDNYIDTGKVKLIFREVYFDRYGLWASMVARCGGPDKFFGVTDLIFKGQSDWTRAGDGNAIIEELRKIGRLAGLDNDTLTACLQDADRAQTLVAWYQKNQVADDIEGTPSFIVNGKKVSNQPYADFSALIDAELGN